jgi:DNA primase
MSEQLLPVPASQVRAMTEAVSQYESQITGTAAQYLANRGIDQATAQTFRLGVVGEAYSAEHVRYQGMLAIPYLGHPAKDEPEEVWAIRFHCFQKHEHMYHGKYNTMKGDTPRLFYTRHLYGSGSTIHLTEGEFDAMILNKLGMPAMAVPGAHSWQMRHSEALRGFSRIYLWADPDEAGAELATTVSRSLRQTVIVRLAQDVTDTYKDGGANAIREALERSKYESD